MYNCTFQWLLNECVEKFVQLCIIQYYSIKKYSYINSFKYEVKKQLFTNLETHIKLNKFVTLLFKPCWGLLIKNCTVHFVNYVSYGLGFEPILSLNKLDDTYTDTVFL